MPATAVQAIVAASARQGVRLPGVSGEAPTAASFAGALAEHTKSPARPLNGQRIYELGRLTPSNPVAAHLRQASSADRDVVVPWLRAIRRRTG